MDEAEHRRAAAFLQIANDPDIDVLWWARGGYGAGRLIVADAFKGVLAVAGDGSIGSPWRTPDYASDQIARLYDINGYREDIMHLFSGESICSGVEDCMRSVRLQVRSGADIIKITATGGVLSNTALKCTMALALGAPHYRARVTAGLGALAAGSGVGLWIGWA